MVVNPWFVMLLMLTVCELSAEMWVMLPTELLMLLKFWTEGLE